MTASQVRWASTHDWFLSSKNTDSVYTVTVRDFIFEISTQEYEQVSIKYTDINKLKSWAGY